MIWNNRLVSKVVREALRCGYSSGDDLPENYFGQITISGLYEIAQELIEEFPELLEVLG